MKTKRTLKSYCEAIAMIVATLTLSFGLAACNSDDDDIKKAPVDDAQKAPAVRTAFNDLAIFQNSIIERDEQGNFVDFFYGEQLDATNPRHLFIGVDKMKEAEDMFRLWFAPDVNIQVNGNGLSATLSDEQGRPQGTVFLTPGTEENHVAEVTFSPDMKLDHFDQITFLLNSAWPMRFQTVQQFYLKFDIVSNIELKGIVSELKDEDKRLNMVCIQSSGNGVKPIFCAISNYHYMNPNYKAYVKKIRNSKYVPGEVTAPTAITIQRILLKDWSGFVEAFKEAASGKLEAGTNYWYDESHTEFIWTYNGVMDYHSGFSYGEDDGDVYYPFLFRIFDVGDNGIYDGASL